MMPIIIIIVRQSSAAERIISKELKDPEFPFQTCGSVIGIYLLLSIILSICISTIKGNN